MASYRPCSAYSPTTISSPSDPLALKMGKGRDIVALDVGEYFELEQRVKAVRWIEVYVILTSILLAILFLLGCLKNRIARQWLQPLTRAIYMLLLVLIPYILGLMGESGVSIGLYGIWAIFLLFAYSSFDNLSAFNLEMRNDRMDILSRFFFQFLLLILLIYALSFKTWIFPILVVFSVVFLKVAERLGALAHAAGVTLGLRENKRRVIRYMNEEDDDEAEGLDPVGLKGFKYLVGPKFSTVKDDKIADGITVEKMWGCEGGLFSSGDPKGQLKDTCLSFALFWLLLGKFWGYPLYERRSKIKAWKLVHDGFLAGGDYERVFRVIEVELCFFHDYFYSKYFFFYLNGSYSKLCALAFPVMFWWYNVKYHIDYEFIDVECKSYGINTNLNPVPTTVVTSVVLALEMIQFIMFITSRWSSVILLSYYAKREVSSKTGSALNWCIEKVVEAVCRISLCVNSSISKPWKRELDQYALLGSCSSFGIKKKHCLQALASVVGISIFPSPGRRLDASVPLQNQLKKAVLQSLHTHGPKLSNGLASLRQNEVENDLAWACQLKRDAEVILVWHIATSICEMHPNSQQTSIKALDDFKVATTLSKYCAYLLAFAPTLLSVSLLEAESMCDNAIEEARGLLKKSPFCPCGTEKEIKHETLMDMLSDKEAGSQGGTLLQRGVKLCGDLHQSVVCRDETKRWKILAEFWAEMILFLAQPNHNEMVHAEKLAEGAEFITLLWALLVHAGIVERDI